MLKETKSKLGVSPRKRHKKRELLLYYTGYTCQIPI